MRWIPLILVACSSPGPEVTELVDEGVFCIDTADGDYVLDFQTCLSSSCDTLIEATCTGVLDGDRLILATYARIESEGDVCTDDCGLVVADCELPIITDTEDLVVVLGDSEVPFRQTPSCSF